MGTKTLSIRCSNKHNCISIDPIISDILIVSISIPNDAGIEEYISSGIQDSTDGLKYRYKTSSSPIIYITISHDNIDTILESHLGIIVQFAYFVQEGKFTTPVSKIKFAENVSIYKEITNEADYALMAKISIRCISNSGTSDSFSVNIPMNEKGIMAMPANSKFLYKPKNVNMYMYGEVVDKNNYTYTDTEVTADFDLSDGIVTYYRDTSDILDIGFATVDSNYNIKIKNKYDYIEHSIVLKATSIGILRYASTPIIKQIAVITSND